METKAINIKNLICRVDYFKEWGFSSLMCEVLRLDVCYNSVVLKDSKGFVKTIPFNNDNVHFELIVDR